MYVIGTAGHVDHGKSTLVKTLTGIDPDRLVEEQRREMTIDLGFAWMDLPSGRNISIVDVPGHERFIKNMLAGIGGIDAALLVIAADESFMPQTYEHLAILDLLGLQHGLVVLTKADLVDNEWLALVEEEVAQQLQGTSFANAPVLAVSARSGSGLQELRHALDRLLDGLAPRSTVNTVPRLPIDRSFTIGGFGTVVTGTLLDGPLQLGQEVQLMPQAVAARVRGLQSQRQKIEQALPGTRVAVNLAGVHHSQIARGDVLTLPDAYQPSDLLDVQLRLLSSAPRPMAQNDAYDLFVGAAEVSCRVTLLDRELLQPGETGWVQLRLAHALMAARGDRFILRQPSPSQTIGGGPIMVVHPARHRRFRPEVIAQLEALARGNPADLLLQALGDRQPLEWVALLAASALPASIAAEALASLQADGRVLQLSQSATGEAEVLASQRCWQNLLSRLREQLARYHQRFPLRVGMPRADLRSRLVLETRAFEAVLLEAARQQQLACNETSVWLIEHQPRLSPGQRREVEQLLAAFRQAPYMPPTPELDAEVLGWLLETRTLVRVSAEVFFQAEIYDRLLEWVRQTIQAEGSLAVARLRDQFGTSRKYALALLEHLDERKITRRVGDARVLSASPGPLPPTSLPAP